MLARRKRLEEGKPESNGMLFACVSSAKIPQRLAHVAIRASVGEHAYHSSVNPSGAMFDKTTCRETSEDGGPP